MRQGISKSLGEFMVTHFPSDMFCVSLMLEIGCAHVYSQAEVLTRFYRVSRMNDLLSTRPPF